MDTRAELVKDMLKGVKGCQFGSFTYTAKESGEKSKITVILGASTENLYRKDVEQLEAILPSLEGVRKEVAEEILASRKQSLTVGIGQNDAYTCKDVYEALDGLPGVKVHKETGDLHVVGLIHHKTVLQEGVHKVVNSKPRTLVKQEISKTLPSARFRQYRLGNVTRVAVDGMTLVVESE